MTGEQADGREPRRKRWGLRTLFFLGLALAALLWSNVRTGRGEDPLVILTVVALLCLGGAAYCSVRGLRGFSWLQR